MKTTIALSVLVLLLMVVFNLNSHNYELKSDKREQRVDMKLCEAYQKGNVLARDQIKGIELFCPK